MIEHDEIRFEIKRLEELYQQKYNCPQAIGLERAFWQCNRKSKCPDKCKAFARQRANIKRAKRFFGVVETNMSGLELLEAVRNGDLV